MMKFLLLMMSLVLPIKLIAGNVIDLHGDESPKAQQIINKYAKSIGDIEDLQEEKIKNNNNDEMEKIVLEKERLIEQIKKDGNYLYVDLNTIYYPQNENKYTTIEVIRKDQPERLRFVQSRSPKPHYKAKKDLINGMIIFQDISMRMVLNGQLSATHIDCPVYHCTTHEFQHPKFKPYLAKFNTGAIKQKKLIVDTLNSDPDPERRAAAAFLMGHFTNPQEIVALLLPHVHDKDSGVRNNVIRVIAATIKKANITQINPKPFLELLDSPETTDRNKALFVLGTIAESKTAKQVIKQQGGKNLLSLLKLKQLNNHGIAYEILKKISGKNYSENNFSAWKNWLETNAG